jgi:hypothetical protein
MLAIGSENTGASVIVEVYNLDSEKDWKLKGKFTELVSHADRRDLDISYADSWKFYHDAVLSADGHVLVIGTSKVNNDNYDGAIMIVTTYKWNSSTDNWDVMENTAQSTIHDKPQATTWEKNALPYQMMVLCLQYAPSLALLCTLGMPTIWPGFHEMSSLLVMRHVKNMSE